MTVRRGEQRKRRPRCNNHDEGYTNAPRANRQTAGKSKDGGEPTDGGRINGRRANQQHNKRINQTTGESTRQRAKRRDSGRNDEEERGRKGQLRGGAGGRARRGRRQQQLSRAVYWLCSFIFLFLKYLSMYLGTTPREGWSPLGIYICLT